MKKLAGLAVTGIGALTVGLAAPGQAAVPTHISGNLQYTSMQYWCDNGRPNFTFSYRTLNKTESKITFSASGYRPLTETNVSPYWASNSIHSAIGHANQTITVHAVASTTGSSFNVSGKTPSTCKGLPTKEPVVNWAAQGKPTAQPTKPAPAKPAPAKPAPAKPAPVVTKPAPAPAKPAPVVTKPAPAAPAPGMGPKVDTDYTADNSTSTLAVAAGVGALALAGAGTTVAVRRRK